jgi:nitroreductase
MIAPPIKAGAGFGTAPPLPPSSLIDRRLLPPPRTSGGMPLMQALNERRSIREFALTVLPPQDLADLLWAAAGVNRPVVDGRTAPSAMNSHEVDVFAALPEGLYAYQPQTHTLERRVASDVRRVTGYQDFVDSAALDLIYVADLTRMKLVPLAHREAYAAAAAGAMAQNVYLYCASVGLATVIRAWIDRGILANAMELGRDQQILLSQSVGCVKP